LKISLPVVFMPPRYLHPFPYAPAHCHPYLASFVLNIDAGLTFSGQKPLRRASLQKQVRQLKEAQENRNYGTLIGIGLIWPAILGFGILLMPESPRFVSSLSSLFI
jgi:hypothetical protein